MRLKQSSLDLFMTLLVVLASGNPAFQYLFGKEAVLVGLPMVLFAYGFVRGLKFRKIDFLVYGYFVVMAVVHLLTFGFLAGPAILGFLLKVLAALLLVRAVSDFSGIYVRVMSGLAALSLTFFVPQVISVGALRGYAQAIAVPLDREIVHVGVHNFHLEFDQFRNSGMFWEPGAFGGYLMLAILLLVGDRLANGSPVKTDPRFWLLVVALLSTQSTTAYVALGIFSCIGIYLHFGIRKLGHLAIVGCLIAAMATLTYVEVPFLAEKINGQLENTASMRSNYEINRFGNAKYDMESILLRPVLGWSPSIETRSVVDAGIADMASGQGNGLTGLIVRFGFLGAVIYMALVYRFFKAKTRSRIFSAGSLLVVMTLLVGEQFLNFPLFLTLMFSVGTNLRGPIVPSGYLVRSHRGVGF